MKRVNAENEFFNGTVDDGTGKIIGPLSMTCDPEKSGGSSAPCSSK